MPAIVVTLFAGNWARALRGRSQVEQTFGRLGGLYLKAGDPATAIES